MTLKLCFIFFFIYFKMYNKFILKCIFSFLRYGIEPKRDYEFCNSTRNGLQNVAENKETECLNTRFPLPTLLFAEYSVKLISYYIFNIREREISR